MTDIQKFNRRFTLHSRPHTLPSDDNFKIERVLITEPDPGKLLIKIILVALSPWQNQRMKDFKNYTKPFEIGELIDCDVLGQVVGRPWSPGCQGGRTRAAGRAGRRRTAAATTW